MQSTGFDALRARPSTAFAGAETLASPTPLPTRAGLRKLRVPIWGLLLQWQGTVTQPVAYP